MSTKHPGLTIKLVSSNSASILEGIRSGSLDAGFVFGDCSISGVDSITLGVFRLVVAGAVSCKQKFETATWEDLASYPWIGNSKNCPFNRYIDSVFKDKKLARNIAVVADQSETVIHMVCNGTGLAVLLSDEIEAIVASENMCVWDKFNDGISLSFAYREKRDSHPALGAVLGVIKTIWGNVSA